MKRVVVVAEDTLIVEAIGLALRKCGEFSLMGRVDGQRASVEEVLDASPDVVLIDEMEPIERVLELIRQIKAENESVAVITLTLAPEPAQLDEIFDAGATGAVSKATHPLALATLIRETMDGHVLYLHKPLGSVREPGGTPVGAEDSLLSAREREVLELVAAGSTNGEIARQLWVTEQTVKFHLSNVYRKLAVGNRTEASHYAYVHGLVSGGQPAAAS